MNSNLAPKLENIFKLLEPNQTVETSNVIDFVADNGRNLGKTVKKSANLGNGKTVSVFSKVGNAIGGGLVTAGLGFLTMEVGAVGALLAPVLGVTLGLAIAHKNYPELFPTIEETLKSKGKTKDGKVIGYIDPQTGNICFDEETINTFKDEYIKAGVYANEMELPSIEKGEIVSLPEYTPSPFNNNFHSVMFSMIDKLYQEVLSHQSYWQTFSYGEVVPELLNKSIENFKEKLMSETAVNALNNMDPACYMYASIELEHNTYSYGGFWQCQPTIQIYSLGEKVPVSYMYKSTNKNYDGEYYYSIPKSAKEYTDNTTADRLYLYVIDSFYFDDMNYSLMSYISPSFQDNATINQTFDTPIDDIAYKLYKGSYDRYTTFTFSFSALGGLAQFSSLVKENAIQPQQDVSISITFPEYISIQLPTDIDLENSELIYPVPIQVTPSMTQQEAQNPDNSQQLDLLYDLLLDLLPALENAASGNENVPDVDPEPQPDPLPLPENPDIEAPDNPTDPNIPPEVDNLPMLPTIPETVATDSLFKVYNPTASQLNDLGSFLWSTNILDQIIKIWQNPLDGIISLSKVYATPQCSEEREIVLGNIGSNVNSKLLSNQFTTINCGTVIIPELKNNATDYSPFTTISIYLPFIGIMELDSNEVMNSEITLFYHVDFFTGTCLAEIYVKRDCDLTSPKVLYTYTGNCSQSIPLTSSDARGLISSLLSLGSLAVGAASGGGLAVSAAHTAVGEIGGLANQEMQHVSHSGALSSNAGIMGQKKPYIIISRQQSYDANGYNSLYGYPSNATVYLANCSGYQKIKAIHLQSDANGEEKREIEELLLGGVIV